MSILEKLIDTIYQECLSACQDFKSTYSASETFAEKTDDVLRNKRNKYSFITYTDVNGILHYLHIYSWVENKSPKLYVAQF